MAHSATSHPVRRSTRAVTCATLVPRTDFGRGGSLVTTTNGSSSYAACIAASASPVSMPPVALA